MAAEHLHKKEKLIAGHIEERKGWLYGVLNYTVDGKRKQKFVPTGLKAKGNKTRANDMLMDIRREWTEKLKEDQKAVELKEAEERGEISHCSQIFWSVGWSTNTNWLRNKLWDVGRTS